MSSLPSVDEVRSDLANILARFRAGRTRAFSFGDGVPEAVILTYDEFEDLDGPEMFAGLGEVLEPTALAEQLPALVEAARSGRGQPVLWGEREAVLMSTTQYRDLRGVDHPPTGVIDDPTVRTYANEPLPASRPLDLHEWAARMGTDAQELFEDLRCEEREDI
jgi:hypothetical protein